MQQNDTFQDDKLENETEHCNITLIPKSCGVYDTDRTTSQLNVSMKWVNKHTLFGTQWLSQWEYSMAGPNLKLIIEVKRSTKVYKLFHSHGLQNS